MLNKNNNEIIYNLYIDESATIKNKFDSREVDKFFIVGGYLIKGVAPSKWKDNALCMLNDLINKYNIPKNERKTNLIFHRNELRRYDNELTKNITRCIFDYIYKHDAKFVYMYDNNTNNISSTKYYYINFVALLVVKTLNEIVKQNKYLDNKIILNVTYASRQDRANYNNKDYISLGNVLDFIGKIKKEDIGNKEDFSNKKYINSKWRRYNNNLYLKNKFQETYLYREKIETKEINAGIMENIEELKIKYGLLNNNISINLSCEIATKNPVLVIADYFCNTFFAYKSENKIDIEIFESIPKENILFEIPYNTFDNDIEIYFDKKDYFNIINKYVFYKKIYNSTVKNKEYEDFYIKRIEEYIKNDKHVKINRYLIAALKSFLENTEYESNSLHNYNNIIDTYNILIDFFRKFIEKDLLNAIIFTINTEKLAVYNHAEDYNNALTMIKENDNIVGYVNKNPNFQDRLITFNNLSSVFQWHTYNALKSIELVNENISILENEHYADFKEDIAKLYGTLGQSYIIYFYISNNYDELIKAENYFNKSIEILLSIKSKEILREYNYLMLLYIIIGNEDKFIEYLLKYLNLYFNKNDSSLDSIDLYIKNEKDKDKSYKYFIIRILKYCNFFDSMSSKKISEIIISNKDSFINNRKLYIVEDIDILKEYSLLCYKNGITNNYIVDCHKFMENQKGYFNDMRKLSLYIIEILMDNDSNFNEALKIIEYLSTISEHYKQAFSSILDESKINNLNKKEWALKVRNKLYM